MKRKRACNRKKSNAKKRKIENPCLTYLDLLASIFTVDNEILEKVVFHWMEREVQKKAFIKPKKISSDQRHQQQQSKSKKKVVMFQIEKNDIKHLEFNHYAFFKGVLQLRENLEIIGTNLYLFQDKRFGIPISKLKKEQSHIVSNIYQNRNDVFRTRIYGLTQNILKDSYITKDNHRIADVFMFQILKTYHSIWSENLKKMIATKGTMYIVKNKSPFEDRQTDKIHLLSTIRYIEQYQCELKRLLDEIRAKNFDCDVKISEDVLETFISNLGSIVTEMKYSYDDNVH
jgi:hypothetical protein